MRDTWEIPKSRVKIDKRRWGETLLPVLDRLGHELGVPSGRTLRAELHSMLVYAPGQFFVEHQDSEKDDAMVGGAARRLRRRACAGARPWSAYEEQGGWYQRSGYSRWDDRDDDDDWDDDSDGDGTGDYDLEELIESEVTLDSWIDSRGGRLENAGLLVGDDEVCASTPSGDLEPYSSEYEGYMGNSGNTLERWYHRGAVVVWPRSRAFAVQAEASPSWALDELTARTRKGEVIDSREAAATLTPFWDRAAARVEAKGFFAKALRTARLLDEPILAAMLLRPFRLEMLTVSHAKPLSALVDSYGERWAGELVVAWSATRQFYHPKGSGPEAWMASLPRLCLACREAGDAGASAARLVLRDSWGWLSQSIDRGLELSSPSRREQTLSELGRPLAAILEGASEVGAD